jgi:oligopeptide/dipeptide ABC transporter ATP-binding protein
VSGVIQLNQLKKYFPMDSGFFGKVRLELKAVDEVSFGIEEGETFGLVGESGCGKTTIGKVILRLYEPTSGQISFMGKDVSHIKGSALDEYRRNIQAVFQNPYASLNPRMRIWKAIGEPLLVKRVPQDKIRDRVAELLDLVMLPADCGSHFPHEMSAGQRQQIAIGRALSMNPKFIVLDEPTSLLDVSAQASMLNMILELQKKLSLTYLFISHNLAVVRFLCHRVGVMYCGKLVELADSRKLYSVPKHPYTQALLASILEVDPDNQRELVVLEGDVISPINPPKGCRFYTRCKKVKEGCRDNEPALVEIDRGHYVACHDVSK